MSSELCAEGCGKRLAVRHFFSFSVVVCFCLAITRIQKYFVVILCFCVSVAKDIRAFVA